MVRDRALPSIHDRTPLAAFIRERLGPGGRLDDPMVALPDEPPRQPGGLLFAPGALDGIKGHHGGAGASAPSAPPTPIRRSAPERPTCWLATTDRRNAPRYGRCVRPLIAVASRSRVACAIVLVCSAGVVSCSDDVPAPGAVAEAPGSTTQRATTSVPAGTTTGYRAPEPIENGRRDALVIREPVTCMRPGQSSEFALTNPTDVEIGFGPHALFFDDYPSRQTGRIMGVANAGRRLSEQQPPGVVELPAVEFVPLPAGDTMMLTVIAPPEERTWTLIIATAALGQPYDHEGELVMPIQVSVTC